MVHILGFVLILLIVTVIVYINELNEKLNDSIGMLHANYMKSSKLEELIRTGNKGQQEIKTRLTNIKGSIKDVKDCSSCTSLLLQNDLSQKIDALLKVAYPVKVIKSKTGGEVSGTRPKRAGRVGSRKTNNGTSGTTARARASANIG